LLVPATDSDDVRDIPRLPSTATLRDALAQMVLRTSDRVLVVEPNGNALGILTIDALASLRDPASP
jgi:CBS domain-containing protein